MRAKDSVKGARKSSEELDLTRLTTLKVMALLSPFFFSVSWFRAEHMFSSCPLCASPNASEFHQDKVRHYLQCADCKLVFVAPSYLPNRNEEKAEYDLHENNADDEGYRRFLTRMYEALTPHLSEQAQGIDFGCGQTRLLASVFETASHKMDVYDPNYFPDSTCLNKHYDFIVCTEAIEHFHHPAKEWEQWQKMLKPGGCLGIMTKRVINAEKFANWHYKNDKTHVSFFSEATFRWLAQNYNYHIVFPSSDIVILEKLN